MTTTPIERRRAGVPHMPALAVLLLALALALTESSCRMDVLGPARDSGQSMGAVALAHVTQGASRREADPVDTIHAMVPEVTQLHAEARGDSLYIRGQVRARSPFYSPFYGPGDLGGWSLQVFLDTDPFHTAYWRGYDYVVRGVEWTPATKSFVTRQITLDPDTPGGWGPESGVALFVQRPRNFEIAIPVDAVGGVQRDVGYCVETYATIECPACEGGLTQEWADDYFATLGDVRSHEVASAAAPRAMGLAALLSPLQHHGAAADRRLNSRLAAAR